MAKTEASKGSCPDCIILENNTVVPWDNATQEAKEQYLEENRPDDHGSNGLPDKGNGKAQRKKQRRPRHHS